MKRMKPGDIKHEALIKYSLYISHFGLWNAKRIVWRMYKMLRDEEKRRKELEKTECKRKKR